MALDYRPLLASYAHPKVIFMVRNVFDVADLFNGRASEAELKGWRNRWPWDRRSAAAVEEWNAGLRNTLDVLDKIHVMFVAYESFFSEGALLDPLFEFLGLPMTDSVVTAHRELMLVHGYLDAERATKLSSLEKLHIAGPSRPILETSVPITSASVAGTANELYHLMALAREHNYQADFRLGRGSSDRISYVGGHRTNPADVDPKPAGMMAAALAARILELPLSSRGHPMFATCLTLEDSQALPGNFGQILSALHDIGALRGRGRRIIKGSR